MMEKTDQKPLQKEKRTRSAGRIAGMAAGIAVGVLAAAYLAVCIAAAAGSDRPCTVPRCWAWTWADLPPRRFGINGSGTEPMRAAARSST